MTKDLSLLILTCLLTGCYAGQNIWLKDPLQPEYSLLAPNHPFIHMPKNAGPYEDGLRDGCETFTGIMGGGTLRLLATRIDGYKLTEDKEYLRGFMDAASYCTFAIDWDTH